MRDEPFDHSNLPALSVDSFLRIFNKEIKILMPYEQSKPTKSKDFLAQYMHNEPFDHSNLPVFAALAL